jgi:hypothetical protein
MTTGLLLKVPAWPTSATGEAGERKAAGQRLAEDGEVGGDAQE